MKFENYFLGIDLSTQQIKCVVVNSNRTIIHRDSIQFSDHVELKEFGTKNGAIHDCDGQTVCSPVLMWIKSIDLLIENMSKIDGLIENIKCVSGCAQQHGTVYWKRGSEEILRNLDPNLSLENQLKNCFSRKNSPIWMDSSTEKQCEKLEEFVGGAEKMSQLTGSRAHHRFSAAQILKFAEQNPKLMEETERISLISSFLASLFIGKYSPIDFTDGSGMNLMKIQTNEWNFEIIDFISKNLREKLGELINPNASLGKIDKYWQAKYGFSSECFILPFLGDNPSSLAGLCLSPNDIGISLGTSDTIFFRTKQFQPSIDAHIFGHFSDFDEFMVMVCFKNGSLTREKVRKMMNCDWDQWQSIINKTKPGNSGNIGFFFDSDEIAPRLRKSSHLVDSNGKSVENFEIHTFCRAVFESQCFLKLIYAQKMGFQFKPESRLLVTGGASKNQALLQMLSDVFNCETFTISVEDSAALGAAYRAKYAFDQPSIPYHKYYENSNIHHSASPNQQNAQIYNNLLSKFEKLFNIINQ